MTGVKKTTKFQTPSPKDLEKVGKDIKEKAKKVTQKIEQTSNQLEKKFEQEINKSKENLSGTSKRRSEKNQIEKGTILVGVILLIRGIIQLRSILWGIILVIIGLLLVSGTLNPLFEGLVGNKKTK